MADRPVPRYAIQIRLVTAKKLDNIPHPDHKETLQCAEVECALGEPERRAEAAALERIVVLQCARRKDGDNASNP
jgi:hypothetical protein